MQLHFHRQHVHGLTVAIGRVAYGAGVELNDFQTAITTTYGERDRESGVVSAVAWLAEEVGELAQAVRKGSLAEQRHEVGDVLAWLASLAAQLGVDLGDAASRFADGCPRCSSTPCACP
jgi:NTP pyrophosphatase (non-canonical NTP hydrolase)